MGLSVYHIYILGLFFIILKNIFSPTCPVTSSSVSLPVHLTLIICRCSPCVITAHVLHPNVTFLKAFFLYKSTFLCTSNCLFSMNAFLLTVFLYLFIFSVPFIADSKYFSNISIYKHDFIFRTVQPYVLSLIDLSSFYNLLLPCLVFQDRT